MRPSSKIHGWLKQRPSTNMTHWRRVRESMHYWLPYNFMHGKALAPTNLTLDVTYICNLKCEMCPQAIDFESEDSNLLKQYKEREELKTEQILKLIDEAANYGVKVFKITGGEAFLRKDILTLIESVKKSGMQCRILTNGMLINQETAFRIVKLSVDQISVSVDGPEEIHNRIRKHPASFQRLIQGVKFIQEEKQRQRKNRPYVSFSNTISAGNVKHLRDLMDVAGQHRVDLYYGYLYYATEKMEEETAQILKMEVAKGEDQNVPEDLKEIDVKELSIQMREIRRMESEYGIKAIFSPNMTPEEVELRYNDDSNSYVNKCFYPWNSARVNPYGDVYVCGPISIPMGNVAEVPFTQIWNNQKFRQFRRKLKRHQLFPKCTKCCALNDKLWSQLPVLSRFI